MAEDVPDGVGVPPLEHERAINPPRATTSASLEWLVAGYRRALARFVATAKEREAQERFIPLFETLHWAVAIMDYWREHGSKINDRVLDALRFARDTVHHQWADALDPRDVPLPQVTQSVGGRSRVVAPPTVVEWFWKSADGLPEPKEPDYRDRKSRKEGKVAYGEQLEGRQVQQALDHFDSLLLSELTPSP